jgi:hypothetical protein
MIIRDVFYMSQVCRVMDSSGKGQVGVVPCVYDAVRPWSRTDCTIYCGGVQHARG